jgi:hypothetical protein
MKHYLKLSILFLLLFLLTQCQNDEPFQNYFSVEIDGALWETKNVSAVVVKGSSLFSVEITAKNDKNETVFIKIFESSQSGVGVYVISHLNYQNVTYTLSENAKEVTYQANSNCAANVTSNQIQVEQLDDFYISGNFEATLCLSGEQKILKNGKFNGVAIVN